MVLVILIIIIVSCIILYITAKHKYKFGVCNMINGGVKSGKTSLVVSSAIKSHRNALIRYYIRYAIVFLDTRFMKKEKRKYYMNKLEKPLIYSNIPIRSKYYVPLTTKILKRQERIRYCSSVILSEVSLVANSMNYKDELLNEEIELFIKLFGHETHNGTLWIDTQALGDNHYSIKRSIDTTTWIEKSLKLPFIVVFFVHRLNICDEQNITNQISDTTNNTHVIIMSKTYWKKYDRFCYSVFTDNMPINENVIDTRKIKSLKVNKIPTFRKFKTIKGDFTNEDSI